MIFDTLAAIVERHYPQLFNDVNKAKLFVLPYPAHEVIPQKIPPEEMSLLEEEFFLPFRTIAVEDPATCTILIDTEKDQKGIGTRRLFMELIDFSAPQSAFDPRRTEGHSVEDLRAMTPPGTCKLTLGSIDEVKVDATKSGFWINITLEHSALVNKQKVVIEFEPGRPVWQAIQEESSKNMLSTLQEVMWFNTPSRFVVEVSSPKAKKKAAEKKHKRIVRSDSRPHYTLLTPGEIRKILRIPDPDPTGRHPAPHWRRRHKRFLTDPRYTKKRFKWVDVPATWVGPDEAIVEHKRYKIRWDL